MKRRSFLKSGLGYAGLLTAPNLFSSTALARNTNEYKAIVIIDLIGGNDSLNMLIPKKNAANDSAGLNHNLYSSMRNSLAVSNNQLPSTGWTLGDNHYTAGIQGRLLEECYTEGIYDIDSEFFGLNGLMPEVAQLYQDGSLATLCDVAPLVAPYTKEDADEAHLPPQIYSHNSQRKLQYNGNSKHLHAGGWGERVATALNSIAPNISFAGSTPIFEGSDYLSLKPNEPSSFTPSAFDNVFYSTRARSPIGQLVYNRLNQAKSKTADLGSYWGNLTFTSTNVYGDPLFTVPTPEDTGFENTSQGELPTEAFHNLESVARMMHIANHSDYYDIKPAQQVFYVQINGFDHHSNQSRKHPQLLRALSLALWDFYKATNEITDTNGTPIWENTIVLTQSDFGRTAQQNSSGTDHAWAGHQLIMGGPINGKKTYSAGSIPNSLELGGPHDFSDRGRYIPTTSTDQVLATVAKWYGVDNQLLSSIFPNLENFTDASNDIESALISGLIEYNV